MNQLEATLVQGEKINDLNQLYKARLQMNRACNLNITATSERGLMI